MNLDAASETRLALLSNAPPNHSVALSADETRIVGIADTFEEAANAAERAGETDPLLVHVPADWALRVL